MKKKVYKLFFLFIVVTVEAIAQTSYENPVISGFYPDPSICKVNDEYYLVNSSFEYFPGIPLFHSRDLINWEQIGYCLSRKSQLNLNQCKPSGGIYAPTIRYHDGTFYVITTNVTSGGNFLVYTDDPKGEWSDPVWIKQGGIDPSLYFEGDKCYMVSNPNGIVLSEINPKTGKILSEPKFIWRGTGGRYPEGPHIYKKDGWYYLLISEGGTEYGHKITIARSKNIYGPYEGNPDNPILTHINENAQSNPIQGTGHADFIQAHDGSWWVVFLGFRPQTGGTHHLLGRETFLAPVGWKEGKWPIINDKKPIELKMKDVKTLPMKKVQPIQEVDNFDGKKLNFYWNFLRNPNKQNYLLSDGKLYLTADTLDLDTQESPTFICRRQQHVDFEATTLLDLLQCKENDYAGITVLMRNSFHYDLFLEKGKNVNYLRLNYKLGNLNYSKIVREVYHSKLYLRIVGDKDYYYFYFSTDNKKYNELGKMDTRFLSSETAGGFTGCMLGLFAIKNLFSSNSIVTFDWFEYKKK